LLRGHEHRLAVEEGLEAGLREESRPLSLFCNNQLKLI
jgi:hypothetical protein